MTMEKQIEEMANAIFEHCNAGLFYSEAERIAHFVIEQQGYRKASEVAEEVINKIASRVQIMISALNTEIAEKNVPVSEFNKGAKVSLEMVFKDLAELKKKYTEGGE